MTAAVLTELGVFLLPGLPLLALLLALLFGRYPGCEAIVRLSERIAARLRPRLGVSARPATPRRSPSFAPAGGLLLALSLSGRAPPATA
ncbi:MAG TPA: hypothetical protein VFT79_11895 [Solirubrobacterales bacterium]|nr:hypothetical protein [Solirubrobacterales bacterium]